MKYKIQKSLFVLTLLASSLAYGQTETLQLSLEQAQELALKNNQSLKNAQLDIDYANYQVNEIRSMGLPQISASGSFVHNYEVATQVIPGDFVGQPGETIPVQFGVPYSLTGTATLNQLLFDGTFFLGLKAASEFVNVNKLLASKSEIDVKEGVLKAYYMALISNDNIVQLEKSLANINKLKEETAEMYKEGYAEKLDVDRLILSASNVEISINNIKNQAALAKKLLLNSIGVDVNQEVVLSSSLPQFSEETFAEDYGLSAGAPNRIEFKILEQQQELNYLDLKRYKVGYMPSIYGMINYGTNSFGTQDHFDDLGKDWYGNGMYALSLNLPIFDGLQKKAKMDQVRVKIEKTKNSLTQLENGINLEVIQARTIYTSAYNALKLQTKSKELANSIYNTTSIKFKEGVGSSFEMINAESELTQANTNYLNALYELSVAKINLDKALGKL
jgi:outer membrane protein